MGSDNRIYMRMNSQRIYQNYHYGQYINSTSMILWCIGIIPVADLVESRAPDSDAHNTGYDKKNVTRYATLSRQTHSECKLALMCVFV